MFLCHQGSLRPLHIGHNDLQRRPEVLLAEHLNLGAEHSNSKYVQPKALAVSSVDPDDP